jgi:tRNA-Thr(GGU) m(6)t(6)A37 methyltransferase TsaA
MPGENSETRKLAVLLGYWIDHNREHIAENSAWMKKAGDAGLEEVADRLKKTIELSREANHQMEHALAAVEKASGTAPRPHGGIGHAAHDHPARRCETHDHGHVEFHRIGTIRTPYRDSVPRDATEEKGEGLFSIVVNEEFLEGLAKLDSFSHIYVLFHLDRTGERAPGTVTPPNGGGVEVGVFSSRSPERPNPIGLSIVRVLGVSGNVVSISAIDALDETPLLDIKPYFGSSDSKPDAGDGWRGEARTSK